MNIGFRLEQIGNHLLFQLKHMDSRVYRHGNYEYFSKNGIVVRVAGQTPSLKGDLHKLVVQLPEQHTIDFPTPTLLEISDEYIGANNYDTVSDVKHAILFAIEEWVDQSGIFDNDPFEEDKEIYFEY